MSLDGFEPGVSAIIAACSALLASFTYRRQNSAKRFEIYQDFNRRFDAENFKRLREKLDTNDPALEFEDYTEKHNLLAFFEEVAVSVNSKIMNQEVAFYFFGYYAIKIVIETNFVKGDKMISIQSPYWKLFREFTDRCLAMDKEAGPSGIATTNLRF